MTRRIAESGRPNRGNVVSATWISSQATARYASATRKTLRRFSSDTSDLMVYSPLLPPVPRPGTFFTVPNNALLDTGQEATVFALNP